MNVSLNTVWGDDEPIGYHMPGYIIAEWWKAQEMKSAAYFRFCNALNCFESALFDLHCPDPDGLASFEEGFVAPMLESQRKFR